MFGLGWRMSESLMLAPKPSKKRTRSIITNGSSESAQKAFLEDQTAKGERTFEFESCNEELCQYKFGNWEKIGCGGAFGCDRYESRKCFEHDAAGNRLGTSSFCDGNTRDQKRTVNWQNDCKDICSILEKRRESVRRLG